MRRRRKWRPAAGKVGALEEVEARAEAWRAAGKVIAYANGCFDLLHLGHVRTGESAKEEGDVLVVGVNGDESARRLKGPGRPVVGERERAEVVAALECVDLVVVFEEVSSLGVLEALKPEVWVKGGDYGLESVNQEERRFVESYGGRVALGERVSGVSTSEIVARVKGLPEE